MAYIVLPSKGRGYELHLDLAQVSQNVALNQSTVSWILYIVKGTGSGAFTSYSCSWSSSGSSGSIGGFNFSGYSSLTLGSGTFTVTHAADGTGTANTSGSFSESDPDPELGNGTVYASLALTTIPRATQPTVSPTSGNTAATYTIGHTPAVSTFYHDVAYSLDNGATYTNIQTNIVGTDVSTDWTPAHSLIPNAGSLTAILRVITRQTSGGTIIGTKTVSLPLTVPSSVKPTISSVTWDDAQVSAPDMPALMGGSGRFVQGWSKLKPTVTSAGAGGSTVTSVAVTQNGQVTPSGTAFGLPVALSGSVPYSAIATDSRVRTSDVYANTVDVTAYNFPNLPTPTVTRTSDAGGTTPSPTGTYLAITPAASVSTLIFGAAEKNLLEWRVRIKQAGGAYSTVQDWTASTVSGNTWTTKYVAAGPYLSSNEYVVEVSIRDVFGKNGYNTSSTVVTKEVTVPSELVFMDWDGNTGIGLGGYRRYGMLDIHGDAYADNVYQGGYRVADLSLLATTTVKGLVELSTDAETATGTATNLATTPASVASAFYSKTLLDGGQLDSRYYPKTSPRVNGIINGAFEFWQRGTSFASPASGSYTADRCFVDWNGTGTRTVSRQAFALGAAPVAGYESANFYRFAQSVAGSGGTYNNFLCQRIEGVRSFAGRTVTVSFWAKADADRTVTPILIQSFGTGGSPSGNVTINGATQAVTTAWQRFSTTTVVPSIAGKTLGSSGTDNLTLVLQSGTINATQTIDIWGLQIEEGSAATAFVRAGGDLTGEQLLCWRYYQFHDYIVGSGDSAGYKFGTNPMGQLLRATPTTLVADTKSGPTLGTTYSSNTNQAALGKGGFYNGQGATAGAFVVFTNVRIGAEL